MQGMSDFKIQDEAFFMLTKPTLSPQGLRVLATAPMPKSNSAGEHAGEVVPQIWTYERPFGLGRPSARSCGCRAIPTPTSRTRRFSR